MKAMRGRIALRTPKAFAKPHFRHTAGRRYETVERVVLNALANQLRLCRRVSCAFGEEQKWSSGEADPPSRVAFQRLPLVFFQLLPYLAFFVAHLAQLALEER
jgi:hypothetical protein